MTPQQHLLKFRLKHALKTGVVVVLSFGLSQFCHLDPNFLYISCIMAFMLMTVYHQRLVQKSIERFLGTVIGCCMSVLLLSLFINITWIYFILSLSWMLILLYGFALNWLPYGCLFATIFTAITFFTGITDTANAPATAWTLIQEMGLTAVAVVLIELFFPTHATNAFQTTLAETLAHTGSIFSLTHLQDPNTHPEKVLPFSHIQSLNALVAHMQHNSPVQQSMGNAIIRRLQILHFKLMDLHDSLVLLKNCVLFPEVTPAIERVLRALNQDFHNMADWILSTPQERLSLRASVELKTFLEALRKITREERFRTLPYEESFTLYALFVSLRNLRKEIARIGHYFKRIETVRILKPIRMIPDPSSIFTWFYSEKALKVAIKITLGVLCVIVSLLILHWDIASQALIATIIILATSNIGQSTLKTRNRFLGIAAGCAIGFILVTLAAHITELLFSYCLLFIAIFFSAFIAMGSEKRAYIGVQIGITVPIIISGLSNPLIHDYMANALLRFVAVLEGGFIAFFINYFLWPDHPRLLLKHFLSELIQNCGALLALFIQKPSVRCPQDVEQKQKIRIAIEKMIPQNHEVLKDIQYLFDAEKHQVFNTSLLEKMELLYFEILLADNMFLRLDDTLHHAFQIHLKPVTQKLLAFLPHVANAIQQEALTPHVEITFHTISAEFRTAIMHYRALRVTLPDSIEAVTYLAFFGSRLMNILRLLQDILTCIPHTAELSSSRH
ncbi:MAG: hypothetical protein A3J38_02535 [Gammaproteobacteria bacterium RIFCSPHIGHO2_12_FULL_45_9]|nr:MAG: hypothetical protein A3J38_02535 [Gammaproteobacteria bacterium RIFCSPHIGHO2_12_FULL_45_9]